MAQRILSGDPRISGPLSGQGYGGPLAPGGWSPDFSEASPAPVNLTPQNPMAVNWLEALHQALPGAAARYRASQFQLGTPQPGLIHDVGYGYGGPVGGAVADMLQPPRTGPEAAMMFGLPGVGAIKAYHGSPHDFERFDMSKVGTGEGAQVYGHGLYFAESPGVAASYKEKLQGAAVKWPNKATQAIFDQLPKGLQDRLQGYILQQRPTPTQLKQHLLTQADSAARAVKYRAETGRSPGADYGSDGGQAMADLYPQLAAGKLPRGVDTGKTYEVSINAEPEHFLDWDKPLREQSKAVQEAFANALEKKAGKPIDPGSFAESGQSLHTLMNAWTKHDQAAASEALRAAGIKGIRYADQGSRGWTKVPWTDVSVVNGKFQPTDGSGARGPLFDSRDEALKYIADNKPTHNYVVFDDKIIDILKKYGIAGLTGGAGAALALQPQQQKPGT